MNQNALVMVHGAISRLVSAVDREAAAGSARALTAARASEVGIETGIEIERDRGRMIAAAAITRTGSGGTAVDSGTAALAVEGWPP